MSLVGCGASNGNSNSGSASSGTGNTAPTPTLITIAPSTAVVGTASTQVIAYGSNFDSDVQIKWNGSSLNTECVDPNLLPLSCSQATELIATVPASDFASTGMAKVTLSNTDVGTTSSALPFNIITPTTTGTTWVRSISNITTPNDIVWDNAHGQLYASIASTDPAAANTIVSIDPVAGKVVTQTSAGPNPHRLSISSDRSYLWAGLDGSNSVQRFLLPGMTKDISFSLPLGIGSSGQQAVALEAAPINPHTVGIVAGYVGGSPAGDGVYVYDDAVQRPTHVQGWPSGPMIDWVQWGANDSVLYGNQYTTIDAGGIATLPVTSSGVTSGSYSGGLALQPSLPQFNQGTGLLYSYGGAYDPVKLTLAGSFNLPETGEGACTSDFSLERYYCIVSSSVGGTDVTQFQLLTYNLSNYAPLQTVYFGAIASGGTNSFSGRPFKIVRWGKAGLAIATATVPYGGQGGIFLIDGQAINPNASPDVSTGVSASLYPSMTSIAPQSATSSSGYVNITITGVGFTPSSTACWSCSYIQFRLLPTVYVSPTQLTVIAPVSSLPTNEPLEISVFDSNTNLFSSNALTFTVFPSSGSATLITPLNLCGLGMAWDNASQLLYVGTADYDGQYPNSIAVVNPATGAVVKTAPVSSDPMFVSDGANGEYLYIAYEGSTNMTQLALPGLTQTAEAVLANPAGDVWYPGDLKAAPVSPHTAAVSLIQPGFEPEALGGVVVFDDGVARPKSMLGWAQGQTVPAIYDTLAWSSTDSLLTASGASWDRGYSTGPLYDLQANNSGLSYLSSGPNSFNTNGGNIHSDFGTGLIYSDNGNVANPQTGALVGSYNASGLVAPDSTLDRTFILGQTNAQSGTSSFTVESFDQKTFKLVSSITLNDISGDPIEMVRWGTSGLAILTSGGALDVYENGLGMLYLVHDATFVSANVAATSAIGPERVQHYWAKTSKRELFKKAQQQSRTRSACCAANTVTAHP